MRARIVATGSYAPKKVMTNEELAKLVETSDEWITERTGIKERRIAADGETTSELAYLASRQALEEAEIKGSDLDMIIVATVTPDMFFPATACILQDRLQANGTPAFDLSAGCAGFIYALAVAEQYLRRGAAKKILVVGAEILSRILNWQDRITCVLFADGAGATVLVAEEGERGILSTHLGSDGAYGHLICIPGGGSAEPATHESIDKGRHYIRMQGNETFKLAVRVLGDISLAALKQNNIQASDLALLIPHQANLRIITACAKRLGVPMEKVYVNVDRYGNTSSASIPLALDEAVKAGRIKENDLVLLASFGAGLSWGSALVRW